MIPFLWAACIPLLLQHMSSSSFDSMRVPRNLCQFSDCCPPPSFVPACINIPHCVPVGHAPPPPLKFEICAPARKRIFRLERNFSFYVSRPKSPPALFPRPSERLSSEVVLHFPLLALGCFLFTSVGLVSPTRCFRRSPRPLQLAFPYQQNGLFVVEARFHGSVQYPLPNHGRPPLLFPCVF